MMKVIHNCLTPEELSADEHVSWNTTEQILQHGKDLYHNYILVYIYIKKAFD